MVIDLNGIALVLLMGAAGSGKSTFARKHFRPTQVLSSDFCRGLVCDVELDQSASKDAFEVLELILDKRLRRGLLTVVDATNVQDWVRAELLEIGARHNAPAAAIAIDLPEGVCLARNRGRDRVVDEGVIRQQLRYLRDSLPELPKEGFVDVWVLRSEEEVASVEMDVR